ncbi:MAG: hypothetical protein NZL89_05175, partial [Leptospiraceae bacterium]|nr:hypothetical protein [Leptospiraceae bacterium]
NLSRMTDSFTPLAQSVSVQKTVLQDRGVLQVNPGTTLETGALAFEWYGALVNAGTLRIPDLNIANNGALHNAGTLEIASGNLTVDFGGLFNSWTSATLHFHNVTVRAGGTLSHAANTHVPLYSLRISAQNMAIEYGSMINVSGRGYAGGQNSAGSGPGAGQVSGSSCGTHLAGGAGHGGIGGTDGAATGGVSYGSFAEPLSLGSGGAGGVGGGLGGAGGGLVVLNIAGTLDISGVIIADGASGTGVTGCGTSRAGGGAGGSINIRAHTLTGSGGGISAKGGNGFGGGGGGGGGRIAIRYAIDNYTGGFAALTKTVAAGGGGMGAWAGTLFSGPL